MAISSAGKTNSINSALIIAPLPISKVICPIIAFVVIAHTAKHKTPKIVADVSIDNVLSFVAFKQACLTGIVAILRLNLVASNIA